MSISTPHAANWAGDQARAMHTQTAPRLSEDWLSVIIGLFIFVLGLAVLANVDLIGWSVTTSVWNNIALGARHHLEGLRLARRLRRAGRDLPGAVGGPRCAARSRSIPT